MKIRSTKFLNTLLAVGLILILAGFLLLTGFSKKQGDTSSDVWPVLILITGVVVLYLKTALKKGAAMLFCGAFLSASGIFLELLNRQILPFTMKQWWPVIVVFSGISLLGSGWFKYRKMYIAYTFPAFLLIVLGGFFLFFSFDIIRMSFRSFVSVFGPLGLIFCGALMVSLFAYQRRHTDFPKIDEPEESEEQESDVNSGDSL